MLSNIRHLWAESFGVCVTSADIPHLMSALSCDLSPSLDLSSVNVFHMLVLHQSASILLFSTVCVCVCVRVCVCDNDRRGVYVQTALFVHCDYEHVCKNTNCTEWDSHVIRELRGGL